MKTVMTKEEFKRRWEKDAPGDGISFDDIADCAEAWGISQMPRTCQIVMIRYLVLKAAGTVDCEEYRPLEDRE